MTEKRRSQRINYLGTGWLQHNGAQYFCRLENISMHGVLVEFKKKPIEAIQHGEKSYLRLYRNAEGSGSENGDFMAQIVRFESAAAGLEFIELEGDSKEILENIISKEQHLIDGAENIINLARVSAELRGIKLTDVHFDKGELIPDRDIHTLRFFAGAYKSKVHLHREDIEEFYAKDCTVPASMEIHKAIDRLWQQKQGTS